MNLLDKIKLKKNKYDNILNKYKFNYFITDNKYLSLIKFNKKIKKTGGNIEYKLNDIKTFLINANNVNGINSGDDINKINIYIESDNKDVEHHDILQKILILIAYERNLYDLYENIIKLFVNTNNKYDAKFKNLISDIIEIIKNEFYKNNLNIRKYKSFLVKSDIILHLAQNKNYIKTI